MEYKSNDSSAALHQWPFLNTRTCFYMYMPEETYFETMKDVPALLSRAIPPGTVMVFIEVLILLFAGKLNEWRLHSAVVSWTSTAMYEGFSLFLLRGIEMTLYQWTFENYRLITLPWNSFQTYLVALLTVEFCGYWWHRMGHELAIMWASHELHHSSDDFNLAVAFRNSAPMRFFRWTFYIPLAFLGVPTSIMFTHLTLGSIYNGFIHQHTVPKLGKLIPGIGHVLEFIFVTPSHHRVHHASNKYCIDRNYGQYMIIWDRLFGTFVEEKEDEPLTYGSLTQPQTYDMAKLQVSSFVKLWEKFQSMDTFGDKMRSLFYGPGWFPGTPRLGNPDDIPDVRGRAKYDPKYPQWVSFYLVLNSFCVFYSFLDMSLRVKEVSETVQFINLVYIFFGYTAIGGLYDKQSYSPALEMSRIVVILGLSQMFPMFSESNATTFVKYVHYIDILVWPFIFQYISSEKSKGSENSEAMPVMSSIDTNKKVSNGKLPNAAQNGHAVQNGHSVKNGDVGTVLENRKIPKATQNGTLHFG